MNCPICDFEKGEVRKCSRCGFESLNLPPGVSQKIVDRYNQAIEEAKLEWQNKQNQSKHVEGDVFLNKESVRKTTSLDWCSDSPGHIVFLIDLSESMENKVDYVIEAIYQTCKSIVTHCGEKERMSVSIYGYNYKIVQLLEPNTSSEMLKNIVKEARKSGKPMFDKTGKAKPQYQTRMQLAFETAKKDVEAWIKQQESDERFGPQKIPAPIVINITDGYPYEGEEYDQKETYANTLKAAKDLMSIKTIDGNVRLFNIHHDPNAVGKTKSFPKSKPVGDDVMEFLYDASSPMPSDMIDNARECFPEADIQSQSKCMISYETEVSKITKFLEWGSTK